MENREDRENGEKGVHGRGRKRERENGKGCLEALGKIRKSDGSSRTERRKMWIDD